MTVLLSFDMLCPDCILFSCLFLTSDSKTIIIIKNNKRNEEKESTTEEKKNAKKCIEKFSK